MQKLEIRTARIRKKPYVGKETISIWLGYGGLCEDGQKTVGTVRKSGMLKFPPVWD